MLGGRVWRTVNIRGSNHAAETHFLDQFCLMEDKRRRGRTKFRFCSDTHDLVRKNPSITARAGSKRFVDMMAPLLLRRK
jgi:hypothetical protein